MRYSQYWGYHGKDGMQKGAGCHRTECAGGNREGTVSGKIVLDSSMVEHTAVNRGVVGSSPTRGVKQLKLLKSPVNTVFTGFFLKGNIIRNNQKCSVLFVL